MNSLKIMSILKQVGRYYYMIYDNMYKNGVFLCILTKEFHSCVAEFHKHPSLCVSSNA